MQKYTIKINFFKKENKGVKPNDLHNGCKKLTWQNTTSANIIQLNKAVIEVIY